MPPFLFILSTVVFPTPSVQGLTLPPLFLLLSVSVLVFITLVTSQVTAVTWLSLCVTVVMFMQNLNSLSFYTFTYKEHQTHNTLHHCVTVWILTTEWLNHSLFLQSVKNTRLSCWVDGTCSGLHSDLFMIRSRSDEERLTSIDVKVSCACKEAKSKRRMHIFLIKGRR